MKKLAAVAAVVLLLLVGSTAWAACGCAVAVVPAPVVSYMPVMPVAVAPVYYSAPMVVYRPPMVFAPPVLMAPPLVAPAPVVVARPVIVRPRVLYVPGQPVRNVLRVTLP